MTTTPTEWVLALGAAALLLPLVGWVLGPRGRQDGVLFTGGYLVAVFGIGGLVDVTREGLRHSGWLVLALLFGLVLRSRWRGSASSPRGLTSR